ncbi:MAG: NAD(P)/FAD-dependent oxidoreductase [Desulfurococcales archaeon]|nr:NAD(P)/FAD-dependent oxidoreductase [Desulfurococcales archaeon]
MVDKVSIQGLGIAGSVLAEKLSSKGVKVKAYDPQKEYVKPCGEAVPVSFFSNDYLRLTDIKSRVNRFMVKVDGKTVVDWDAKKTIWFIIDKKKFVSNLRERALAQGAELIWSTGKPEKGVYVDARGPFSQESDKTIPVYRLIVRGVEWDENTVLIEFDSRKAGFYWVFPAGEKIVNIGGGFAREPKKVVKMVHNYASHVLGKGEIINKAASIITIHPKYRILEGRTFYVGEAAGFVMPSTGEGIRPAILSAEKLSQALLEEDSIHSIYRNYASSVKPLLMESRLSYTLFRVMLYKKPDARARLLSSLPRVFWKRYFSATLSSWKELFFSFFTQI